LAGSEDQILPYDNVLLSIPKHKHAEKYVCVDCYKQQITNNNELENIVDNYKFFTEGIHNFKRKQSNFNCVF